MGCRAESFSRRAVGLGKGKIRRRCSCLGGDDDDMLTAARREVIELNIGREELYEMGIGSYMIMPG